MPVTVQLVIKLTKMQHLTVAQAAECLGEPRKVVENPCRMLALAMAHAPERHCRARAERRQSDPRPQNRAAAESGAVS